MKRHYSNFDWLRLFLACEVVLSHIWGRGGLPALPLPFLAVPSFLAISGFMILQSWRTSNGPGHFWIKRATVLLAAHRGAITYAWNINHDWAPGDPYHWPLKRYANAESRFELVVDWLRSTNAKSVAVQDAGYVPYALDIKIIDLVGLNDEFIAKHTYVRDRTPDADVARRMNEEMATYVIDQHPDVLLQDWMQFMKNPATSRYFRPSGVQFSLDLGHKGDYIVRPYMWNSASAAVRPTSRTSSLIAAAYGNPHR